MAEKTKKKKDELKEQKRDIFKEIREIKGIVEVSLKEGKETAFKLKIDEVPLLDLELFYDKIENLVKNCIEKGIDLSKFERKSEVKGGERQDNFDLDFIKQIPTLLKVATKEVIEIVCLGIGKDVEWFREKRISIHDTSLILLGIWKANKADETRKNFQSLAIQMSSMMSSNTK